MIIINYNMFATNILYVMATGFLMTGSILDFNKDDLPSYFFVIGSSLFFIKSFMGFYLYCVRYKQNTNMVYNAL